MAAYVMNLIWLFLAHFLFPFLVLIFCYGFGSQAGMDGRGMNELVWQDTTYYPSMEQCNIYPRNHLFDTSSTFLVVKPPHYFPPLIYLPPCQTSPHRPYT